LYILGISGYVFDSAACLIKNGEIVAAAQEERFTRKKNTGSFPQKAIQFCLDSENITIEDIDHVSFYWNPLLGLYERAKGIFQNLPSSLNFWNSHSSKWLSICRSEKTLKFFFPGNHRFQYHFVSHHMSHAASTFFVSPFIDSNIIVVDGSGEIAATSYGYGTGNNIKFLKQINFPQSLGYLYVSLTHYLGFKPDSDEYKVMGLASMGSQSVYYDKLKKIVRPSGDGTYNLNMKYFIDKL